MVRIPVYNNKGQKEKEIELNPSVFGVEPKTAVVHQVYVAQMANMRGAYAHTKDRSEVAGGGKKPWRQKGTGRARHGSTRSPIWRTGGVTFGPRSERNYTQKINKKMKQLAVRMCLSDKAADEHLIVVDGVNALDSKTKQFAALMGALPVQKKSTLFLTVKGQENVARSLRNIPNVDTDRAENINVVDLLHHQYVVTTPEAVDVLNNLFKRFAQNVKQQ